MKVCTLATISRCLIAPPILGALIIAAPARATTTFDTPGDFDVTTALDDVVISNGANVTFLPGGSATGPATAGVFAGPGVELQANSSLTVAGGTIVGGDRLTDGGFGGNGIEGFVATGSTLLITSGSVTGGTVANSGFPGDAIRLVGADITITGGTIAGGVDPTDSLGGEALNLGDSTVNISGGEFIGQNTTTLNFFQTGGTISGGSFTTRDQGQILALGSFNTPVTLDITGGEWEAGSLLSTIGGGTTLNVFGTGLQIELTDIGGGLQRDVLTGTLLDGNPIEFVLNPNSTGTINLVPEPASFALLSVGGVLLARRRRHN